MENNEPDPTSKPPPILDYGQPAEKPHPIGMKFPIASVVSAIIVVTIVMWLTDGMWQIENTRRVGGQILSLEGLIMGIVSVFGLKHQSKNAATFLALTIIGIFLNGLLLLMMGEI